MRTTLSSFARFVVFDQRGTGLSDPIGTELPTLEERADDVAAVMDAAGVEHGFLWGQTDGGAVAIMFTARYPERVEGLILNEAYARSAQADDYPIGMPVEAFEVAAATIEAGFHDEDLAKAFLLTFTPSLADQPRLLAQWVDYFRSSQSPSQAKAMIRLAALSDVRALLPLVQVPTLVLHKADDLFIPVELGRYLAEHIEGARLVELPGGDMSPFFGDVETWLAEVEEFVTGSRGAAATGNRILATVLFTDIVASTERVAALGDAGWKELLDLHDGMVRRQLDRFGGREISTTGDGFLATFDGPARAVRCGEAIRSGARQLGVDVRVGVHAGEVERRGDDISGIAVHVAQRICDLAGSGEILVSGTVKDLVAGSGIEFEDRGMHDLKGVPDEWRVLVVAG